MTGSHPSPSTALFPTPLARLLVALATAVCCVSWVSWVSCRPEVRRFPLAPVRWVDADKNHVPQKPEQRFVGLFADAVDKTFFWRLSRLLSVPRASEARNVNALDEVPNSTWYHNRLSRHALTPARVAQGPCRDAPLDPKRGPWVITRAKTEGANPGFFLETPQGRYLLKLDGSQAPPRLTTADVVGSRLWWAAGYHVPCNRVVFFPPEVLRIGDDAETEDALGRKHPMTREHLGKVLEKGYRPAAGRIRAMASRLLPGEPLGPFAYESTRADDPNDVIPHQHRRELRAMRLLTAWINHLDSRQQNSLDLWVEQGGRTYVKHYVLDWGESLGSRWPNDPLSRRLGHSYYFDPWHIAGDFLSLGFVPRPWRRARVDPEARIFGYFRAEGFVASRWKPAYPNPAFRRMTRRDALWMVRIIARFSDDHLRAIVAQARLRDRGLRAHLLGLLRARRDRILREYLTKHAPLDEIRLRWRGDERRRQQICFEHLGVALGIVKPRQVQYRLRLRAGPGLERRLSWHQAKPDPAHPARTCLPVSPSGRRPAELAPSGARDDHPLRYGVLEIHVLQGEGFHPTTVVAIHLYDLGPERGFRLVGIRRRDPRETPRQGLNRSAVNLPSWL